MATLALYITPRSSRDAILGWREFPDVSDDTCERKELAVKLTAAPTDGKANEALLKYLAKELGIPKAAITIKSGHSSRHKRVHIAMEQGVLDQRIQEIL